MIASHADVLTGSSRNHSSPTWGRNARRSLRTFAWEATSATQGQKFQTDDANQCLHDKSGSHGVPNTNLSNFACVLVDFGKVLC